MRRRSRSKARWLAQSRPYTQHTKQNKNTKEKFEPTKCVESVHKRVSGPRPPAGRCSNRSMKVMPCYGDIAALTFISNRIPYHNRVRCALCIASDPILTNFALRPGALKVARVFLLQLLHEALLFSNLWTLPYTIYTFRQTSALSRLDESGHILDAL